MSLFGGPTTHGRTRGLGLAVALTPAVAAAQAPRVGLELVVYGRATPATPEVRVEVLGWFDYTPGVAELFSAADFDLMSGDGTWVAFDQCKNNACVPGPRLEGPVVRDIIAGQLHFPPHVLGNPANPLLIAEGTWTTANFACRVVPLATMTRRIRTYRSLVSAFEYAFPPPFIEAFGGIGVGVECYPDCDTSTGCNVLDVFDFLCFQNRYAAQSVYACDCDTATGPGLCDLFDFLCFQNAFAAGCP